MQTHESTWKTPDGVNLFVCEWKPEKSPRAVIVLVHGLGEHITRYLHVVEFLTQNRIAVLGFDQRGHGRSEGPRGHSPSFETSMEDITHFLREAKSHYPSLPVFLYGHSLGGAEVLYYVLTRKPDLKGAIVTAPGLGTATEVPAVKKLLAKSMSGIMPTLQVQNGLDRSGLSRDPEVVAKYNSDPLVHPYISARFGNDLLAAGPWIINHAAEFSIPLLLLQGSADRLVSPLKTEEFAKLAAKVTTFKLFEGYYHELHNEPEKAQVLKFILDWIEKLLEN